MGTRCTAGTATGGAVFACAGRYAAAGTPF
jgi:hypothetical protein